jgi:hypothetical protein
MKMMNAVIDAETADSNWKSLYQVSGAAALTAGALLLIALVSLIITELELDMSGWFSLFQNNWLVVLFKLNAGFNGVGFDLLYGLNPLDIAIMALVATMYLGLYIALRRTSRIGSLLAAIQPFLGIMIFIATNTAGRSAVMGAGLVVSLVMLRSNIFGKVIALAGLVASVLLLWGDLSTTPDSHSTIIAILIAIGYVLLLTWFFLIAQRLIQLGRGKPFPMELLLKKSRRKMIRK